MINPHLLKQDGSLTHNPKEKADTLANEFDNKQNKKSVILPPLLFSWVQADYHFFLVLWS